MGIERRIEQHLKDRGGLARSAHLLSHRRRKASARTIAPDGYSLRIKTVFRAMTDRPVEGGDRILNRRRKARFGGKPVAYGQNGKAAIFRKPRTEAVMTVEGAADITAAMIENQNGKRGIGRRLV